MYGAGPVYGARPVSPHPYRFTSGETRNAIHPCSAHPQLQGAIVVNPSSTLYRYGRGTELVTEAVLENSPYFFKGDFTRIPQEMIQFWQQTRHPMDFSFSNEVGSESHSVDIEDQVFIYLYGPQYVPSTETTEMVENPPDGNGGEYPLELEPSPEYLDELAWAFNTQNRSWDPEGVPWNSPVYGEPEEFRLGHRHAGWAWKLCQDHDNNARNPFGRRGAKNGGPQGNTPYAFMQWTHDEGAEDSGEIDTGATYYSEFLDEDVPLITYWDAYTGTKRSSLSVLLRAQLVYLSHFGYWHFECYYDQSSSDTSEIYFSSSAPFLLEIQAFYGDFELCQAHLDTCQSKADSFYSGNPSYYYRSLPEFDFDVRTYPYGPDASSIVDQTYAASTGISVPGYDIVFVPSTDPSLIISGTFDWHFAWERCVHTGVPAQDAPTQGNRENFGPVWVHAPSS